MSIFTTIQKLQAKVINTNNKSNKKNKKDIPTKKAEEFFAYYFEKHPVSYVQKEENEMATI